MKMQDRMEDDRRKLKLANHVIKEMKKIADTGPNKSHSKGKVSPQPTAKSSRLGRNDRC